MVEWPIDREEKLREGTHQELGQNGGKVERKVPAQGLSYFPIQADVEPEIEDDDCAGVHQGILQDQLESGICGRHQREGGQILEWTQV